MGKKLLKRMIELEKYLIDCPVCHSKNVSIRSHEHNVDFFVICNECECRTQMYEKPQVADPMSKAVQDWNQRDDLIVFSEPLAGKLSVENLKNLLNECLIQNFESFNAERFYLDVANGDYVSVVTTSISDKCPIILCERIAQYIKRFYIRHGYEEPEYIYVGAWAFKSNDL